MCKFQSGFLPGCSTAHHLVELYHIILLALDSKQFTSVTFVDISKAFDTLWIKGFLLNLEKYGIGENLLIWLNSYLSNRTQNVVIKDALSNIGQLKAGVPQVLGPYYFWYLSMTLQMVWLVYVDYLQMIHRLGILQMTKIIYKSWSI